MIKNKVNLILISVSLLCVLSLALNFVILYSIPINATQIFNNCKSSIVEVKAYTESVGTSYGTAEIIKEDGTLVTNAHVITYKQLGEYYEFENISIRFIDENDYREVSIVKYDLDKDIAILKLECDRQLTTLSIGDDEKLNNGESVFAIGNMSNYGLSITSGIVAIPHINVEYNDITRNVIQCDITISDGNSGGALLNAKGQIVGITSFRLKDLSANIIYGIAYCIPINTVMEYIDIN